MKPNKPTSINKLEMIFQIVRIVYYVLLISKLFLS